MNQYFIEKGSSEPNVRRSRRILGHQAAYKNEKNNKQYANHWISKKNMSVVRGEGWV